MQALRVEALSEDLSGVRLAELSEPERAPGEVLVQVRAASLNFPDLLMTRGAYQFKPDVPFTAGMELAGEVIEADADSGFAPGDRVMGGAKTGAFAELAACPARSLRRVPEGLDWAAAASLGAAYTTAYTALVELGGLQPGQWVLVHGASGGVGLAACDLARESEERRPCRIVQSGIRHNHVEDRLRIRRDLAPNAERLEQPAARRDDRGGALVAARAHRESRIGDDHRNVRAQPLTQCERERQPGQPAAADYDALHDALRFRHRHSNKYRYLNARDRLRSSALSVL